MFKGIVVEEMYACSAWEKNTGYWIKLPSVLEVTAYLSSVSHLSLHLQLQFLTHLWYCGATDSSTYWGTLRYKCARD